ncbi:unnamed protein product [Vitrella brassicaformis CCMP3155]|uniref:Uncharacterized protein n=2 Tax=Vitrella brassicaformis TaxID=1169539 RepID=A0A0G4G5K4_VITBC|nr:unnamed protein product [Vitrella brassicaformis CCMP3155]|mmetsp:Transcript_3614/g.8995  ORF Transcript_3614/g.8995 Transcript_3614/m.8995 type:complete len:545 (+) Transcript_3614:163-1797(+)|eukprot:CEM23748.1 unnamed protein product [Vitrella brassicaformis CCMP3155]
MDGIVWISCAIVTFVGAAFSAGGGIGGGAIYIPTYMVIFGTAHLAVPLSKVTIFGLALASNLFNVHQRHPKRDRPLINYEMCIMLEPATLIGAMIGVYLNVVMTSIEILGCLVVVLSITSYKTFVKGVKQYRQESLTHTRIPHTELPAIAVHPHTQDTMRTDQADQPEDTQDREGGKMPLIVTSTDPLLASLPPSHGGHGDVSPAGVSTGMPSDTSPLSLRMADVKTPGGRSHQVQQQEHQESEKAALLPRGREGQGEEGRGRQPLEIEEEVGDEKNTDEVRRYHRWDACVPWGWLGVLVVCWAVNCAALVYAGGPTGILCGDLLQKIALLTLIVVLASFTLWFRQVLLAYRRDREVCGFHTHAIDEGGFGWITARNTLVYPFWSMVAGVAAGCLGIGGGLVKGPLMLEIGLLPHSAVVSATFMILFTSSSTSLQFGLMGRLEIVSSLIFSLCAFCGALVGVKLVSAAVRRFKHGQSGVTFLLGTLILVSMCCMVGVSIHEELHGVRKRPPFSVKNLCEALHKHPQTPELPQMFSWHKWQKWHH